MTMPAADSGAPKRRRSKAQPDPEVVETPTIEAPTEDVVETAQDEGDPAVGGDDGQDRADSVAEEIPAQIGQTLPTWDERAAQAMRTTASPRQFHHEDLERRMRHALVPLQDVMDEAADVGIDPKTIRVLTQKAMEDELDDPMLPIAPGGHGADVGTPARVAVTVYCPNCRQPESSIISLFGSLTVESGKAELKVKGKASAVPHRCDQEGDDVEQQTLGMAPGEADDAALEADDAFDNEDAEPPTLAKQDPVQLAVSLQGAGFRFSASAVDAWSAEDQQAALEYVGALMAAQPGDEAPPKPAILEG